MFLNVLNFDVIRLNASLIDEFDERKILVFLVYLNLENNTQVKLLNGLSKYKEQYLNITFGYIDMINDKRLLDFFKITNKNDSGVIVYDFKNQRYYIEEQVSKILMIKKILDELNNKKLNWNSNHLIEKIFFLITGKRYGKLAHLYFSIGLLIISILIFIFVNIYVKQFKENDEIEKTKEE